MGQIAEYRGELEIIPELVQDISFGGRVATPTASPLPTVEPTEAPTYTPMSAATAAFTSTPAPTRITPTASPTPTLTPTSTPTTTPDPTTPLGQLGVMDLGLIRMVVAEVVEANSFSAGFKFLLDDGTGQIELLLWTDQYAVTVREALRPGPWVRVTGEVGQYEGVLQIEAGEVMSWCWRPGKAPQLNWWAPARWENTRIKWWQYKGRRFALSIFPAITAGWW